jgi:hypothetical protein
MTSNQGLQAAILCAVAALCSPAFGQERQEEDKGKQSEQTQRPELSKKAQQALANLHALNTSREAYSRAAADLAADPQVREFLTQRAREYERADGRLEAFALMYNVDLESSKMQEKALKTQKAWEKENKKLRKAEGPKAAKMALSTFIERNDDAIDDLRTLRGEVQEEQLRTIINERIADLEQESTRAQQLRAQVQQSEKQK